MNDAPIKDPHEEGHNEPCYYCGEPCDKLAGDPGKWPIPLCHSDEPGIVKWHHGGCVSERLSHKEHTHEPKDPAGTYPDLHHGFRDSPLTHIDDILPHSQIIAALKADIAKQRAVNEALLAWHEAPGYEERNKRFDGLAAALREALK